MMRSQRWALLLVLLGMLVNTTGCRYMTNRYYDFRDTWALGVGVSTENSNSGIIPPALGVYVEATDFLHLGAIRHYGPVAESDLRGSGVYFEERDRLGFGPWQAIHLDQDYANAKYKNYFKTPNTRWENWMKSSLNSWGDAPAKDLTYTHWAQDMQYGYFLRHRGYQYWEYMGGEVAVCDPFFTHFGLYLRAGFDISEISDFLLGWCCIDFKHDDLTPSMFAEKMHMKEKVAAVPVALEPVITPAPAGPSQAELDKLKAENDKLAKELADVKGKLSELEGGLEISLPDEVLFDTGSDKLRAEGKKLLDQVAQKIRTQYADQRITVEGHTDNVPVTVTKAKYTDNYGLGAARALAVLRYLKDTAKLPNIYAATSYADNKPAAGNDTAAGRQQNRRAMIVLRAKK